ncbi:MAG: hypothetical protein Q4C96_06980 [Planctomycetia bacterium]|nr:hypothetical protein [Planctomycetia bacterium]
MHVNGATYQTKNFIVSAHDPEIAQKMAVRAEELRKEMAELWLGEPLPRWYKRAKIKIRIGNLAPGGQTSFIFNNGEVYGWDMSIQGTEERIYDSVLPHEITHMILASHFRCPVPRWADEGAATFTESLAERQKYQKMLIRFLKGQKGIPMDRLFKMDEYPNDPLPLYAQGYSVSEFLIRQRGPKYFVYFVQKSMERECSWNDLIYECYGYQTLQELQSDWVAWVGDGAPEFLGSNLIAGDQVTPDEKGSDDSVIVLASAESDLKSETGTRTQFAGGWQAASPAEFQADTKLNYDKKPRPDNEMIFWKSTNIQQK